MYSLFENEVAAVFFALKQLLYHLLKGSFIEYSDHKSLRAAFEKVNINGKHAS